jgi:hypothetical protein
MPWSRGFFRLWIVASIAWMASAATMGTPDEKNLPYENREPWLGGDPPDKFFIAVFKNIIRGAARVEA